MEAIIMAIRLGLRRAWRAVLEFLERNRLVALPPVTTVAIILAVGLVVPLVMAVDTRPPGLTRSLAVERLEKLLGRSGWGMPEVSPEGTIHSARPAFHWKAHPQAGHYRFRLHDGDDLRHLTDGLKEAAYHLPAPGRLEAGHTYRFTVSVSDKEGNALGQIAYSSFRWEEAKPGLRALQDRAQRTLEPAEAALVLAGAYAEHGMTHDLRTALDRYLAAAPDGKDAELARSLLAR